jgi:hypothetical protein
VYVVLLRGLWQMPRESVICKPLHFFFKTCRGFDEGLDALELPLIFRADYFFYQITDHGGL